MPKPTKKAVSKPPKRSSKPNRHPRSKSKPSRKPATRSDKKAEKPKQPVAKAKPAKAASVSKSKAVKAVKTVKATPEKKAPKSVETPAAEAKAGGKNGTTNGAHASVPDAIKPVPGTAISVIDHPDVQDKLWELVRLAKEQGYLTFDDVNEALP